MIIGITASYNNKSFNHKSKSTENVYEFGQNVYNNLLKKKTEKLVLLQNLIQL